MDDLDRLLSSDDPVQPSARFVTSVMEAIGDVATEPPPLPFPWGRFAAGLLACATWAACGVWLVDLDTLPLFSNSVAVLASVGNELGYASAAIVASLLAVRLALVRPERSSHCRY
jgi:hypothetical protein